MSWNDKVLISPNNSTDPEQIDVDTSFHKCSPNSSEVTIVILFAVIVSNVVYCWCSPNLRKKRSEWNVALSSLNILQSLLETPGEHEI